MTVRELSVRMSSIELAEWEAEFELRAAEAQHGTLSVEAEAKLAERDAKRTARRR